MANSYKKMTTSKVIKRLHRGMFIGIDDIHIKPGFNCREDNERNRKANDELYEFLMNGGVDQFCTVGNNWNERTRHYAIPHPGFANKFNHCPMCGNKVED